MVFFNWATMQMAAKIVYYGPGLCGKTTNLSFIYAKTAPGSRGEMVSLETESDRTLFFDLLPIEVGTIGGFKTRLQLYTVPGQVFYNTTRKLVLKGVDGVVFVADSQRPMREANIESFDNLKENLTELGLDMVDIPLVLQFNKRDLKNVLTIEELNADLNSDRRYPFFEASAIQGNGVFETLKEITKLTLRKLRRRMSASQPQPKMAAPPAAAPTREEPSPPVAPTAAPAQPTTSGAGVSAAALARAAEEGVGEVEPPSQDVESKPDPTATPPDADTSALDESKTAEPEFFEADTDTPTLRMRRTEDGVEEEIEPAADEIDEPEELAEAEEIREIVEAESSQALGEPGDSVGAEVVEHEDEIESSQGAAAGDEPEVEFATDEHEVKATPPVKRVRVDSEMDILGELDNLRKQATMSGGGFTRAASTDLDLDDLLGQSLNSKKELRQRLVAQLNSDVFGRMRTLQLAVRIQDEEGDTITTLDPMSVSVGDATALHELLLTLTLNLENLK